MKDAKKQSLGLNGLDELFMTDQERAENKLPRIYDIPLSEIDDFPDHPFKVRMDEDMDLLVQSVKERGVIVPITLRQKEDGRYELVSGHRRKKACELAGFDSIRAEMTPDEVRMLDNRYALLFIRGERPVMDEKYDLLKHPNVAFTTDGGAPPYEHGKDTRSVGFFRLDEAALENAAEPEWFGEAEFELLSEEELYEEIEQEEQQHEKK